MIVLLRLPENRMIVLCLFRNKWRLLTLAEGLLLGFTYKSKLWFQIQMQYRDIGQRYASGFW